MTPRPWLALQLTLAGQTVASFVLSIAPVVAPAVAPQLGVPAGQVGVFTGTAYLFAMVSGLLAGPWIARIGGMRLTVLALAIVAAGAVLPAATVSGALIVAAISIGIGYGVVNPAAAVILGRHAPVGSTGLFFALKQAGVPMGVALAGLLMPAGLQAFGWRTCVLFGAAACGLLAVLCIPAVPRLDPRERGVAPHGLAWAASLAQVVRRPALRRLSLMSTAYAMAQQGFISYSVSLLVGLGVPLGVAAGLLAASQVASVLMRISTGHVADRWIPPGRMLGVLGIAIAAIALALAALPAHPPLLLAAGVMVLAGASTMGWNGVFFAQLVRVVPREQLAQSAGGTQVFTFAGSMLGPYVFSQFLALGGSYAAGYVGLGLLAGAAGVWTLRARDHAVAEASIEPAVRNAGDASKP